MIDPAKEKRTVNFAAVWKISLENDVKQRADEVSMGKSIKLNLFSLTGISGTTRSTVSTQIYLPSTFFIYTFPKKE